METDTNQTGVALLKSELHILYITWCVCVNRMDLPNQHVGNPQVDHSGKDFIQGLSVN